VAPPLLFLRNRTVVSPAVFRLVGTTATQVGATFGTLEDATSVAEGSPRNRVIQYDGSIMALQNAGVYRLQGDLSTWSNAVVDGGFPFTTPSATHRATRTGLHLIYNSSGVGRLTGVYRDSSAATAYKGFYFNPVTALWVETSALDLGANNDINGDADGNGVHDEAVYRGVLHFRGAQGTVPPYTPKFLAWDPFAGSLVVVANPTTAGRFSNCFCQFNDRLFMLYENGDDIRIAEYTGGTWNNDVATIATSPASLTGGTPKTVERRHALFTDGTYMFAVVLLNSGAGNYKWYCYRIDEFFAVTNLTGTVLPAALTATQPDGGGRMFAVTDVDTLLGTATTYLYWATSGAAATTMTLYQWNGPSGVMTQVGAAGADVAYASPNVQPQGGDRVWTSGELHIKVTERTNAPGGERIKFKCWGDPGPDDKVVRIYFNRYGEPNLTQAILTGTPTGGAATRNGNQLEDVDADGTTEYSLIVDLEGSGIPNNTRAQFYPYVSI
jgi:hypothetical protein